MDQAQPQVQRSHVARVSPEVEGTAAALHVYGPADQNARPRDARHVGTARSASHAAGAAPDHRVRARDGRVLRHRRRQRRGRGRGGCRLGCRLGRRRGRRIRRADSRSAFTSRQRKRSRRAEGRARAADGQRRRRARHHVVPRGNIEFLRRSLGGVRRDGGETADGICRRARVRRDVGRTGARGRLRGSHEGAPA